MRVTIIVLTAAAIALVGLTLSGMGRSDTPTPARPLVKPLVASAAPQQPSDRSAVGTLEQVNTVAQPIQITVATATAKLVFHVVAGATIRQGSKTLKPAELASHKGERVKVRYRESGTDRRADWIVLAAPSRPAKPPKS